MNKHNFTNEELRFLDKLQDDLIIWLFHTDDKKNAIKVSLKKAFLKGRFGISKTTNETDDDS